MNEKKCKNCCSMLPISEFSKHRHRIDGHNSICKNCFKKIREERTKEKYLNAPLEKKCRKCDEVKPISEFYKHCQTADGFASICKKCSYTHRVKKPENNNKKYESKKKKMIKCSRCGNEVIYYDDNKHCLNCQNQIRMRMYRHGITFEEAMNFKKPEKKEVCSIEGCNKLVFCRELCRYHYARCRIENKIGLKMKKRTNQEMEKDGVPLPKFGLDFLFRKEQAFYDNYNVDADEEIDIDDELLADYPELKNLIKK